MASRARRADAGGPKDFAGQNTGQQGTMARHAAKRSRPSVSAFPRRSRGGLRFVLRRAEGCAAIPALDLEAREIRDLIICPILRP